MSSPGTGEARLVAWVSHLREGGTTPWAHWEGRPAEPARHPAPDPVPGWIPGGQQLELLRRVNEAGRPSEAVVAELLSADLPLRGRVDVSPQGADPGTLPDRELLRVAAGILATRALREPPPPSPGTTPVPTRVRRRLQRRPFRLAGDPVLAAALRRQLAARGRPPAGRGRVVVVGADVPRMLEDAWWHRVLRRGAPDWEHWQRGVLARDRLPGSVDLARIAGRWRGRGASVTVAVDARAVGRAVGVRRLAGPPPPDPVVAELARLVGAVLGVEVPPEERGRLLRERVVPSLTARAEAAGVSGRAARWSPELLAWSAEAQERLQHRLRRGDYPVAGEPPAPGARAGGGERSGLGAAVVRLAVSALLDQTARGDHG